MNETVPVPWWGRPLVRFFDWADRVGAGPQGDERCPWVTPSGADRCVEKVGHRGTCTIRIIRSAKGRPDRTWTDYRYWYGINYDVHS